MAFPITNLAVISAKKLQHSYIPLFHISWQKRSYSSLESVVPEVACQLYLRVQWHFPSQINLGVISVKKLQRSCIPPFHIS